MGFDTTGEDRVENAGLAPWLAGREFSVGMKAGQLGAGAGAAGRAVVNLARAEDEVPAVASPRIAGRTEDLDVVDLATVVAGDAVDGKRVTDFQLDQRIRGLFGVSASLYITRRRIEHSRHLLERTDQSISDIAFPAVSGSKRLHAAIPSIRGCLPALTASGASEVAGGLSAATTPVANRDETADRMRVVCFMVFL